jgi:hypothetical protein
MPLESAQRDGDAISCPYHGYKYQKDGRCSHIPTGGIRPKSARLRSYPIVERGPVVWIWMGEEANADPALLPKPSEMGFGEDPSGWRFDTSQTFNLKARPALLVDNLFDLSHIAFIHSKTLALPKEELLIEPRLEQINGHLRVSRGASGVNAPGSFWASWFPELTRPIYRELITELHNPGLINAAQWLFEVLPDGSKGAPIAAINFVHVITPETAHSAHYLGLISRNFRLADDESSSILVSIQDKARREDVVALDAIEHNLDQYASSRREISTKADEGALKIRQHLRQMIRATRRSNRCGC